MTWEYKVSTGILSHNGELIAYCYSGAGESKDKPNCEHIRNKGPFLEVFILLQDGIITKAPPLSSLNLLQGPILLAGIISKFMAIKKGSHRERHLQGVSL